MVNLPQVTLVSVSTKDIDSAAFAMVHSMLGIKFGAAKLLSPTAPDWLAMTGVEHIVTPEFASIDDWNYFLVYSLHKCIETDFILLIHPDGFVVNPNKWRDEWLQFDYCGSPWDIPTAEAIRGDRDLPLHRVGNSVGLRSKKLLQAPTVLGLEWKAYNGLTNEDTFLAVFNREALEQHGCKFAPLEEALLFSRENITDGNEDIEPFCFHKWHNQNHPNWGYPKF